MKMNKIPLVQACPPATAIDAILKNIASQPGFSIITISDCFDGNASMRVTTRLHSLFNRIQVKECPLKEKGEKTELEAAICVIDAIDAKGGGASFGLILINAAWREREKTDDENGSRFGYLLIGNVLILSTVRGKVLSLVKRFFDIKTIRVFNTREVLAAIVAAGELEPEWADHISESQFRSFTFQPLVAALLCQGKSLPYHTEQLNCPNLGPVILYVDAFGLCKTAITTADCSPFPKDGDDIGTRFGTLKYYRRLTDAPLGKPAIVSGSSGLGAGIHHRFLEIVIRDGNAAETLGLKVGDSVF